MIDAKSQTNFQLNFNRPRSACEFSTSTFFPNSVQIEKDDPTTCGPKVRKRIMSKNVNLMAIRLHFVCCIYFCDFCKCSNSTEPLYSPDHTMVHWVSWFIKFTFFWKKFNLNFKQRKQKIENCQITMLNIGCLLLGRLLCERWSSSLWSTRFITKRRKLLMFTDQYSFG